VIRLETWYDLGFHSLLVSWLDFHFIDFIEDLIPDLIYALIPDLIGDLKSDLALD
jgi:hypothetical protein